MGIPTNIASHDDVRVMYGNPFDNTITINNEGQISTKKVEQGPCEKCQSVHIGRCAMKIEMKTGRWFFVDDREMECNTCGGKFGGGSTSRPGGSGLISQLRTEAKHAEGHGR